MGRTATRALLVTCLALLPSGAVPAAPSAKGMGQTAAAGGVAVGGHPYRYTAMSPNVPGTRTVIARTDLAGGRVDRWWYLPGRWFVPAVAYDLTGGGLSADGSTLVLSSFSRTYPPRLSRFAILDTERHLRHPWDPPEHRAEGAITRIALEGDFSFDAISPDGRTAYLTHRLPRFRGPAYIANHEIRALDIRSGRLLPEPVLTADEQVDGVPITRATGPDGRWAYTLYDGNAAAEDGSVPLVEALDTETGRVERIELPDLADRRNLFMLGLRTEGPGELALVSGSGALPRAGQRLARIDIRSFEVATSTSTAEAGPSIHWPALAGAAVLLAAVLGWRARRRQRRPGGIEAA